MDHLTILLECPLYVTCHFITHCLSSACGRCYVCFVLRSCTLTGLKTKHTKLLPQVDDKWCIIVIPSSLTPYLDPIPQNLFTKVFGASVDFNATYFFTIVFWLWALRNHRYILSSVQPGDSYNPWCHPNNRGEIKVAEKETECTSTS